MVNGSSCSLSEHNNYDGGTLLGDSVAGLVVRIDEKGAELCQLIYYKILKRQLQVTLLGGGDTGFKCLYVRKF